MLEHLPISGSSGAQERTRVPFTFKDIDRNDRKKIVERADSPKKNPGALAGATGANGSKKAANFQPVDCHTEAAQATHIFDRRSGSIETLALHRRAV